MIKMSLIMPLVLVACKLSATDKSVVISAFNFCEKSGYTQEDFNNDVDALIFSINETNNNDEESSERIFQKFFHLILMADTSKNTDIERAKLYSHILLNNNADDADSIDWEAFLCIERFGKQISNTLGGLRNKEGLSLGIINLFYSILNGTIAVENFYKFIREYTLEGKNLNDNNLFMQLKAAIKEAFKHALSKGYYLDRDEKIKAIRECLAKLNLRGYLLFQLYEKYSVNLNSNSSLYFKISELLNFDLQKEEIKEKFTDLLKYLIFDELQEKKAILLLDDFICYATNNQFVKLEGIVNFKDILASYFIKDLTEVKPDSARILNACLETNLLQKEQLERLKRRDRKKILDNLELYSALRIVEKNSITKFWECLLEKEVLGESSGKIVCPLNSIIRFQQNWKKKRR